MWRRAGRAALALDGVFVAGCDGAPPRWVRVAAPSTEEVQQFVLVLSESIEVWLDRQGFGHDDPVEEDLDDDPGAPLLAAAVAGRVAHGKRAGAKVRRLRQAHTRPFRLPPRCGESGGYNLHAGVVIAARDREGLERLCRYVLRPPLARTRMARRPDGLWVLTLRKPYSDGTTAFIFSELELVEKLAALVPPARKNLVSYHGVVAPRHGMRSQVVPKTSPRESLGLLRKEPRAKRSRWVPWADLLWRVFGVDGHACVCGGRLALHAVVIVPATFDVLASLHRSGVLAANAAARGPPGAAVAP